MSAVAARRPPFALLLVLAWLATAAWLLADFWDATARSLGDTDDAMRLVEVRAFLAGRGWFDLLEPRVQPPVGYESHWSRLIDAGLAGLYLGLRPFADGALAERLMRALWPLLWLLPAIGGAAAIAWRIAGRGAALAVLVLALFGLPAFQQFKPGRIDHHNVQIALVLLALAVAAWSDRVRWAAMAAGLVTGLALAIGLEGLPYLAGGGAALALRYIVKGDGALARYGPALAAATLAAFLVSVGPPHWGRSACDAIAVNWLVPVLIAGVGMGLVGRLPDRMAVRLVVVAALAAAAMAAFALIEPRCLGGPYAMMDAAAKPIWLAQVREMEALWPFARAHPVMGAWIAAFPVAALAATLVLARDASLRRDHGFLLAAGAFLLAFATTVTVVKASSYAMWLGMPLVAALAARWVEAAGPRLAFARALAALALTPLALAAAAITFAQAAMTSGADAPGREACVRTESYAPLARLPAGLVAAHVDDGPFLLALTPHAVLAAPYHRLSAALLTTHDVFARPAEEARQILARAGVTYVAICGTAAPGETGLKARLQAGDVPDWLARLPGPAGAAFAVFRVKS